MWEHLFISIHFYHLNVCVRHWTGDVSRTVSLLSLCWLFHGVRGEDLGLCLHKAGSVCVVSCQFTEQCSIPLSLSPGPPSLSLYRPNAPRISLIFITGEEQAFSGRPSVDVHQITLCFGSVCALWTRCRVSLPVSHFHWSWGFLRDCCDTEIYRCDVSCDRCCFSSQTVFDPAKIIILYSFQCNTHMMFANSWTLQIIR